MEFEGPFVELDGFGLFIFAWRERLPGYSGFRLIAGRFSRPGENMLRREGNLQLADTVSPGRELPVCQVMPEAWPEL